MAQLVRQRLQNLLIIFPTTQATSSRNDISGSSQFRPIQCCDFPTYEYRHSLVGSSSVPESNSLSQNR